MNLKLNRDSADFNQYLSQSISNRALAENTLPEMDEARLFLPP